MGRGPSHVGRPDAGQESDAHAVNRRAAHRTSRLIIVSPDAQAPPRSAEAGCGRSLFLHLPRHRRPLPVPGARPAERRCRRGRHGAVDRPGGRRAARHRDPAPQSSSERGARCPRPRCYSRRAVFAALIFASSLANGAVALVAAGKLVELAALTLGAAVLIDSRFRLATLATVVVVYTCVVTVWAAAEFVGAGGGRQASFVGEHELGGARDARVRRRPRAGLRGSRQPRCARCGRPRGRRFRGDPRRVAREPPRPVPRRGRGPARLLGDEATCGWARRPSPSSSRASRRPEPSPCGKASSASSSRGSASRPREPASTRRAGASD